MPLATFHPAMAQCIGEQLGAPTPAQERGWPAIRAGGHVLIAAPTGTGKTLAAFLDALDELLACACPALALMLKGRYWQSESSTFTYHMTAALYIPRTARTALQRLAAQFPAVAITGPRQSGKSTVARQLFVAERGPGALPVLSLEDPDMRQWAHRDPRGLLANHAGGAVIDEVQRVPDLLSYLQGIIDEDPCPGRWILTGSAQLDSRAGVSQSLAGRCAYLELLPFTVAELGEHRCGSLPEQVLKGNYPPLYDRPFEVSLWHGQYLASYLDRDLRALIQLREPEQFRAFLTMLAGHIGQQTDWSRIGSNLGISHATVRTWFGLLQTSYIAFTLPSYHRNFRKRLLKKPKIYWWDTGLACRLLGIRSVEQLLSHPAYGALCENWWIAELRKHRCHRLDDRPLYFWRDQRGLEVDALSEASHGLHVLECKAGQTVASDWFASLGGFRRLAEADGRAVRAALVHGGEQAAKREGVDVLPWHRILDWDEASRSGASTLAGNRSGPSGCIASPDRGCVRPVRDQGKK